MSDLPPSSVSPTDASSSGKRHPDAVPSSLRPLAPRPPPPPNPALAFRSQTSSSSSQSASSRRPGPPPCPVCYRVGCQLVTHTTYSGTSRSPSGGSPAAPSLSDQQRDPTFTSSYAYVFAQQYAERDMPLSKADLQYELPLEPARNTPEMHRLFYSCKLIDLTRGRPQGLTYNRVHG